MKKIIDRLSKGFEDWAKKYHYRLILLNVVLIGLFLLHSVGYFHPYFPISINFIILIGLILCALLLNAGSRVFFVAGIMFWAVSLFFKVVRVDVWAVRTGDYVFQMIFLGAVLLVWEKAGNVLSLIGITRKR